MISLCNNSNLFHRRLLCQTHMSLNARFPCDRTSKGVGYPQRDKKLSLAMLSRDRASLAAAWAEVATPRADYVCWQLCALAYAVCRGGMGAGMADGRQQLSLCWIVAGVGLVTVTSSPLTSHATTLDQTSISRRHPCGSFRATSLSRHHSRRTSFALDGLRVGRISQNVLCAGPLSHDISQNLFRETSFTGPFSCRTALARLL